MLEIKYVDNPHSKKGATNMLEIKYVDNPHSYYINGQEVASVSKLLGHNGGGSKSIKGYEFHEYMHNFAVTGDHKYIQEIIAIDNARSLKERIGAEGIIENLGVLLKAEKLQFIAAEFVVANKLSHDNKDYYYAGTLDVLCARKIKDSLELFILDYKTGSSKSDDHCRQLELYANAIKYLYSINYPLLTEYLSAKGFTDNNNELLPLACVKGVVIYRDSQFITKDLLQDNFDTRELALAYYGAITEKVWHGGKVYKQPDFLKDKMAEIADLLQSVNELQEKIKEQKEALLEYLDDEGYKDDRLFVFKTKGKTTCNLRTEAKTLLLEEHPEYFETTQSKPSFTWKLL